MFDQEKVDLIAFKNQKDLEFRNKASSIITPKLMQVGSEFHKRFPKRDLKFGGKEWSQEWSQEWLLDDIPVTNYYYGDGRLHKLVKPLQEARYAYEQICEEVGHFHIPQIHFPPILKG